MQTVYLTRWHDEPLVISDEGLQHMFTLVQQYLVCETCGQTYGENNPQVAQNLCLSCLVMRQKDLVFAGPNGGDEKGRTMFTFLDTEGYVYVATAGYSEKAVKDTRRTLVHWGFPFPATYKTGQEEITLYPHDWKIHGDLRGASVIVLEYNHYSPPRFSAVYLSYKADAYRELTKRDGEMKRLLQRARETVEATRGSDGQYHIGNHATSEIWNSQVYEVVSAMESAVYNIQLQLRSKKPAEPQEQEQEEIAS